MPRRTVISAIAALLTTFALSAQAANPQVANPQVANPQVDNPQAANPQVKRGKYLVGIMGCTDCHTPGNFFGHPDQARYLGGSDVGFGIPNLGVFVGPNLTPDPETGLGKWTAQQIVTAITKGERPDGRILAPSMPWRGFAGLTEPDALAVAAFLKSLPPVHHKVAGPFGPNETPTVFVLSPQPGPAYAARKP